jgi:hypothetical protein
MIGLLCFALAVLTSPFKSKLRLEAENAVLRPIGRSPPTRAAMRPLASSVFSMSLLFQECAA